MVKQLWVAILCFTLAAPAWCAPPDSAPYAALAALQPGRKVTVETRQPERKLKGSFVRADGEAVTVRLKSGSAETIPMGNIRRVTARRKVYRYAVPVGAAAGGALVGALAARPKMDFVADDIAWLAAAGAGLGALAGLLVGAAARTEVVYEGSR